MCISQGLTFLGPPPGGPWPTNSPKRGELNLPQCSRKAVAITVSSRRTTTAANRAAVPMHFVDQFRNVLRRRELRNAMPEIEHVSRVIAEAVEHRARFHANGSRRRKQHRRVDIALERDLAAYPFARLAEIDGPVEPDRIDAGLGDLVKP